MTSIVEAKAALERGRPVVLVVPPAPARAGVVWELLSEPPILIVVDAETTATEWADAAPPAVRVHAVTGLARSARLLGERSADVLAGTVADLSALVSRSALKLEHCRTVVLAWPEGFAGGPLASALDALLAECKDARRVVLSWNPSGLRDFLERHARRAETMGTPPTDADGRPLPPVAPARYVVVPHGNRTGAARDALDALNRPRVVIWRADEPMPSDAADAVLCLDLPTRAELKALAAAGEAVVLVTTSQLAYLRSIAAPLVPLPLSSAADRALDRLEGLRATIAERVEQGSADAELSILAPLFERYDPAEVAAALLALQRETGTEKREAASAAPPAAEWVRIFVNVGKKDHVQPKDLVGALTKEVKVPREAIGRIELRETFALVEIAADAARTVVQNFTGVTVRGRRVLARLDQRG